MLCSCIENHPTTNWQNYYNNYQSASNDLKKDAANANQLFVNFEEIEEFKDCTFSYYLIGLCDDMHQPHVLYENNCQNLHVSQEETYIISNSFKIKIWLTNNEDNSGVLSLKKENVVPSTLPLFDDLNTREGFHGMDYYFGIVNDREITSGYVQYSENTTNENINSFNEIILRKLNNR